MSISYRADDRELSAADFLLLVQKVWPGDYDAELTQQALQRTMNCTAWDNSMLVGCSRVLTDGYFFGTMPEVLVDPAYQRQGIGRCLMELAWENCPTSLFLGAQAGNEPFFEKLGFERSLASFCKKKPRQSSPP
jgi:ribosomal protein S18 acetylase RimI-like enzyme